MATGTTNIAGAVCHIPELWASDSRDAVEANVVLAGLVDNDTVSDLKGGPGDTLNIPYISNPSASSQSNSALLKSDRFVRTDYVGGGGEKIREAFVGRIYGFDTYKTTLITAPAAGQAENFACQKRGVYFCSQDMK